MGFQDGLKICMWFFQNPEIIFYYFFRIFNLGIFGVLILQKYIGSMYLVPLTPPQFLAEPFETLQVLLGWSEDMHVFFFRILKLFFITFYMF